MNAASQVPSGVLISTSVSTTFFAADADCVPITNDIPWSLTRQWLDLVACSGTALFISVDPVAIQAEHKPAIKAALAEAARTHPAS